MVSGNVCRRVEDLLFQIEEESINKDMLEVRLFEACPLICCFVLGEALLRSPLDLVDSCHSS